MALDSSCFTVAELLTERGYFLSKLSRISLHNVTSDMLNVVSHAQKDYWGSIADKLMKSRPCIRKNTMNTSFK